MLHPNYKQQRPASLMLDPSVIKNKMVKSRLMDEQRIKNTHVHQTPVIRISPQRGPHHRNNSFLIKQEEYQHCRKRLKLKDYLHLRQIERSRSSKSLLVTSKCNKPKIPQKIVPAEHEILSKQQIQDLKEDEYFSIVKEEIIQKFKKQGKRANDIQNWIFQNIKNTASSNKNQALIFVFQILEKVDEINKIMETIGKNCKEYRQNINTQAKLQVSHISKQNDRQSSFFWDEEVQQLLSPAKITKKHITSQFNLLNARI